MTCVPESEGVGLGIWEYRPGRMVGELGPDAREPISFVWLLSRPRGLDEAQVQSLLRRTLGAETAASLETPPADGDARGFVFRHEGAAYLILDARVAYFRPDDFRAFAAGIEDPEMKRAFEAHTAWVGVDLIGPEDVDSNLATLVLGKVSAALADGSSVLLFAPHVRRMALPGEEVLKALRGPQPLSAFRASVQPKTLLIAPDDDEMERARQTAKERWPEFLHAWKERKPGQTFFVKGAFSEDAFTEHMWVMVSRLDEAMVVGVLNNDPVDLKRLRSGDRVMLRHEQVEDWIYQQPDGSHVGGWTAEVLMRRERDP